MDKKIVSVEGTLSPEYKTILKNLQKLGTVLGLPVNRTDVSILLTQYELISPDGNVSGTDMIKSVLSNVAFKAIDFYKFLAVLRKLNRTEEIFKILHQEFYGRLIYYVSSSNYIVEVQN